MVDDQVVTNKHSIEDMNRAMSIHQLQENIYHLLVRHMLHMSAAQSEKKIKILIKWKLLSDENNHVLSFYYIIF